MSFEFIEEKAELRFATHIPYMVDGEDIHVTKITKTTKDGKAIPELKIIKDYKVPYWITKERYRNHKQKKSWEEENKLLRRESTGVELVQSIGRSLRMRRAKSLRELFISPYLYGANISTTTLLKHEYNKDIQSTPYTVAAYDIETDTTTDTILMASIAMLLPEDDKYDGRLYLSVVESFVETDTRGLISRIKSKILDLLSPKMDITKWDVDIEVVKNEMDVVRTSFNKAHEWKPDFLAIWNMSFDVVEVMKCCDRWGVDYRDIFCDPLLENKYKYFKWKPGQTLKITTDGDKRPIPYSEQWHVVEATASFYIIDAMCVYRRLRMAAPQLPGGYGLDNVLDTELGERKLKIAEADKYTGLAWHVFMTKNYKDEYIIYNMWDTISMLYLDKKTTDLSMSLPMFAGYSDFSTFNSSTKVMGSQIYFYLRNIGMVPGTPDPNAENDKLLLGLRGWISTLPATHIVDNGLKVLEDYPSGSTNIRAAVFDADAISSYPSDITALNVSKETCARELISVDGINREDMKLEGMNLMMGDINASRFVANTMGLPRFTDIDF